MGKTDYNGNDGISVIQPIVGRRCLSATMLGALLVIGGGLGVTMATLYTAEWSISGLWWMEANWGGDITGSFMSTIELLRLGFGALMWFVYALVEASSSLSSGRFRLIPNQSRFELYFDLFRHHTILVRDYTFVVAGAGITMIAVYAASLFAARYFPEHGIGGMTIGDFKRAEELFALFGYFCGLGMLLQAFFEKHYPASDAPRTTGGQR